MRDRESVVEPRFSPSQSRITYCAPESDLRASLTDDAVVHKVYIVRLSDDEWIWETVVVV